MNAAEAMLPEDLVEQLAQIDVAACFEDPERLKAAMAERQAILTALQNTDTRVLSDDRRERLNERLQVVLKRNGELLLLASERLEMVRKAMQQLAPGRAAVRGYGEQREYHASSIRRVG